MKSTASIRERLGKEIYRVRRSKGHSQSAVAKHVQLSVSQYRKIEKGLAPLPFDRLMLIARGLNVDLSELIQPFLEKSEPLYSRAELDAMKAQAIEAVLELDDPRDIALTSQFFGLTVPRKPKRR